MREATPRDTQRLVELIKERAEAEARVMKHRVMGLVAEQIKDLDSAALHAGEEVAWEAYRVLASSGIATLVAEILPPMCEHAEASERA